MTSFLVFLYLIPYSINHLHNIRINTGWHLGIHNDIHISCSSIGCSSFSRYFELCSWSCSRFYPESEHLSIDSFYWEGSLIEKIKKWNLNNFCYIETFKLHFFFFFWGCFWFLFRSSSTREEISKIELKSSKPSLTSLSSIGSSKLREYILISRKIRTSSSLFESSSKWISLWRSKLIIVLFLWYISESLIGFIDFLELLLSVLISFIAIWMIFHCLLLVGFFYIRFTRRLGYTEYVIIVFIHEDILSKKDYLSKRSTFLNRINLISLD